VDHQRFDDLARSLVAGGTRRRVLGALAAAAIGLAAGRPEADAARRCPKKKERCNGDCVPVCKGDMIRNRRTSRCECPDGMKACGTTCVGDDRCCPGEKACGGGCIHEAVCCPHTHKACPDGTCLPMDAGKCCPAVEQACAAAPGGCCNTLAGEECTADGCCNTLVGETTVCNNRCVDVASDPDHCGACGNRCQAGCQVCDNGTCRTTGTCCQPGQIDCGGRCLNPKWDDRNCGGCGVTCGECEWCNNGTCTSRCAEGWHCCGGISCCEDPKSGR
jgi:hypothetical protein